MKDDEKNAVRTALLMAVLRGKSREREIIVVPSSTKSTTPVSELLEEEALELCIDRTSLFDQGWLPIRIIRLNCKNNSHDDSSSSRRPCIIHLHPTGSSMDSLKSRQEDYAMAGYVTVAIDARYHGQRSSGRAEGQSSRDFYEDALVRAWRDGSEHPFLLDTTFDITRLLDYLLTREDIDSRRIGITGYSLGGMHAWLSSVVDERIGAVAICSGVQGFQWALDNKRFKGRVESIPKVFQAAAKDLGKDVIDAEVVERVWNRIVPGLLTDYDASLSLPTISPRPVLVLAGELDARCPIAGVKEACDKAREVYARDGASNKFEFVVEKGVGHRETVEMINRIRAFFDSCFRPSL